MLNGKNAYPSFSAGHLYFGQNKFKWVSLFTVFLLLCSCCSSSVCLGKAPSLDSAEIVAAFLRCTGFIETPVKDLLATDNRDGHHTEVSDL